MKTSILTMVFNRSTGGYVDLNAGKASPEEADDAEETETGEDTLDADAHEGKED